MFTRLLAATALLCAWGCGDATTTGGSACVTDLANDCRPLYDPPTFSVIFQKILHPTCAQGMGTCHTADAAMAGLVFEEEQDAYERLLGVRDGRVRVLAGDPACSRIVQRLASSDPGFRMPPGPTPLLDAELCDITLWIAQGAAR